MEHPHNDTKMKGETKIMGIEHRIIHKQDSFGMHDELVKRASEHKLRGRAIAGYDLRIDPVTGLSSLGEVIAEDDNVITVGGTLFALEKLFNVSADLNVAYLNDIYNVGTSGEFISEKYPKETCVCLWNAGIGGAGAAYTDTYPERQQFRELPGGSDARLPFRIVDSYFTAGTEEYEKYWLSQPMEPTKFGNKIGYFAKTFSKKPTIKALWKDAGTGKDGSPVTDGVHESTKDTPIETFAEVVCTAEVEDFREYFELLGIPQHARFNTIGLCTGIRSTLEDMREEYKQVRQFSVLTFGNELLHMDKDLSIIYRVYSA